MTTMNEQRSLAENATAGDIETDTTQKRPVEGKRTDESVNLNGDYFHEWRRRRERNFFEPRQDQLAPSTSNSTSSNETGQKGSTHMTATHTQGLRIATICGVEVATDAQIEAQYREAFPDPRERFELSDYAPYITEGSTIPFVTRRGEDAVTTSLVEDMGDYGFLLSYLWTDAKDRCKGIGLAHLKSVLAQLSARKPGAVVFIEVEDPAAPRLTEDQRTIRTRRLKWYEREFGAQQWVGDYMMPSLRDLSEHGVEGILLAVADRRVSYTEFLDTAIHILTASYDAADDHAYVTWLEAQRI